MASLRTPKTCSRVLECNWKHCTSKWSQCPERDTTSVQDQIPTPNHPASAKSNQTTIPHSPCLCRKKHSKSSDKESDSFLVQQFKNVSRIRDGVSNMMTGFVSVEQPGKWFSECQRYLPFSIKIKTTIIRNDEHAQLMKTDNTLQIKPKSVTLPMESGISKREQHSLETHIQNTNDGIGSFYDIATETNNENENNNKDKSTVYSSKNPTDEEFSMLKLLVNKAAVFGLTSSDSPDGKSKVEKKPVIRKDFVSRTALASRTLALVQALKLATSNISRLKRAEDLSNHLLQYSECRSHAIKVIIHSGSEYSPGLSNKKFK